MPFCKACGTYYTKSLGICPTCNAEAVMQQQPDAPEPLPPETERTLKRRRWVGLVVGIPLLIALIYLLYYIRFALQS